MGATLGFSHLKMVQTWHESEIEWKQCGKSLVDAIDLHAFFFLVALSNFLKQRLIAVAQNAHGQHITNRNGWPKTPNWKIVSID